MRLTEYNYELDNSAGAAAAVVKIGQQQITVAAGATINVRSMVKTDGSTPSTDVVITRSVIGHNYNPVGGQLFEDVVLGAGDGSEVTFTGRLTGLQCPVDPGSFVVTSTVSATAAARGNDLNDSYNQNGLGRGYIEGAGVDNAASWINYQTGEYSITFGTAPDNATNVTATWVKAPGDRQPIASDF